MTYRHRQFGLVTTLSLTGGLGLVTAVTFLSGQWRITLPVGLIIALCIALFHALTVSIEGGRITALYGLGPLRFRWSLSDIREVRVVRNRWWYGWGIKFTPHGWLFNVSGLEAVELDLASGKRVRIGTDEPEALADAVRAAARLS